MGKFYTLGDHVKIKGYWKMKNENESTYDCIHTHCTFRPEMRKYCGKIGVIVEEKGTNQFGIKFLMEGFDHGWDFSSDMFDSHK